MGAEERRQLARLTAEAVSWDRKRLREPGPPTAEGDFLQFFGTGGNPINLVTQYHQTGGFYVSLGGSRLYVDPGPGALFHAARAGVPLEHLDGVFISHGHTDHYLEAGGMVEAMCRIMSVRRGAVLAPRDFFARGLLPAFYLGQDRTTGYPGGATAVPLGPEDEVTVGGLRLKAVKAYHGPENYGFLLQGGPLSLGYTSDTAYIKTYRTMDGQVLPVRPGERLQDLANVLEYHQDLKQAFAGVDILIANLSYFDHYPARHLTAYGLAHLLQGSGIGRCIVTHLDPCAFRPVDYSAELIAWLTAESGVSCELARDNQRYPLP